LPRSGGKSAHRRTATSFLLFSNLVPRRPLARLLLLPLLLLLFLGPSCCWHFGSIFIFFPRCCCCCCSWHRKRATSCRRASQTPKSMPQRLVAISAKTRDEGKNAKCGKREMGGKSRESVENWEMGRWTGVARTLGLASSCFRVACCRWLAFPSLPFYFSFRPKVNKRKANFSLATKNFR